jgi:hypothetical protein
MIRALALLMTALALLLPSVAVAQSGARVVESVSWVEEWDPASGEWVRVDDAPVTTMASHQVRQPVRFLAAPQMRAFSPAPAAALAAFGPFRVMDAKRAALVGTTDAASPQAFAAMLAKFPGLEVIEFVDAPGTSHDLANLRLGRAIRSAGLATHVPADGSARSGAVELFLAGTRRTVDPGALFAVHSWRDARGREPSDFGPEAPENRLYLDYYTEMGMSADQARAFYAMTNSVPHAGALWLEGAEMERWIAPETGTPALPEFDGLTERALRLALARSGAALAGWLRAPLVLRSQAPAPMLAPQLAFDEGLLDSPAAFP